MGVFSKPGRIEFARIPCLAYCIAMLCVNWVIAALVALYDTYGTPNQRIPVMEGRYSR